MRDRVWRREEEDAGARREGTKALPVWIDAAKATNSATTRMLLVETCLLLKL